jgi:transcription initiation factor IIE alpha subunit
MSLYFWTLNTGKSLIKFRDNLVTNLNKIKGELEMRKHTRFYHCPNCHIEMNEENALLENYTCKECGELLHLKGH